MKIHEIWTIIHEDFRLILVREINFDYKWKKEFFELKRKNSRNLNENSRRFTFNWVWKKYFLVEKKKENVWVKKKKITNYERLFTLIHAHFGFEKVFSCWKEKRKCFSKKENFSRNMNDDSRKFTLFPDSISCVRIIRVRKRIFSSAKMFFQNQVWQPCSQL